MVKPRRRPFSPANTASTICSILYGLYASGIYFAYGNHLQSGRLARFPGSTATTEYSGAGSLINNILPNVYVAGGVIIFFMIIFGGFTIIANAGSPDKIKDGIKPSPLL